jgi:hypothetical protein
MASDCPNRTAERICRLEAKWIPLDHRRSRLIRGKGGALAVTLIAAVAERGRIDRLTADLAPDGDLVVRHQKSSAM